LLPVLLKIPFNFSAIRGLTPGTSNGLPRVSITKQWNREGHHFRAGETVAKLVTEPV
jgi:hypothetical protein